MFLVKPDAAHLCCEMNDDVRLCGPIHPLNVGKIDEIIFRPSRDGNFLIASIPEFLYEVPPQEPLAAGDCDTLIFHFLDKSLLIAD